MKRRVPRAAVPPEYAAIPDTLHTVSLAVPHTVVPQLLRPLLAGPIPPDQIFTRTFTDVQQCAGTFKIKINIKMKFDELKPPVDLPALAFASQLPHLSVLDLHMTRLDANSFVVMSARLPQITALDLSDCDGCRGDALASLPTLRSLRVLNLSRCYGLNVHAMFHVAKCGSLEELAAQGCDEAITRQSLSAVSDKLTRLTSLNLNACVETEASALCLITKLRNLRTLKLRACRVDSNVMSYLSNLSQLRTLVLTYCAGVDAAALAHVSEMSSLEELHLDDFDNIDANALAHVAKLTRLRFLNLSCSNKVDAEGLRHISKLPQLTSLDISECKNRSVADADAALASLAALPRLRTLDLGWCDFDASSLLRLSACTRLEALDLSACDVDGPVIVALSKLPRLRTLSLCRCKGINAESLSHAGGLTQLTQLNVSNCANVDGRDLTQQLLGLPLLKTLIVHKNEKVDDEALRELERRFSVSMK